MTRREFLTESAAFLVTLKAGLPSLKNLFNLMVENARGPLVLDGLRFVPSVGDSYEIYYNSGLIMETNDLAGKMLMLADGTRTTQEIADICGRASAIAENQYAEFYNCVALFFVEAGEAGLLRNKVVFELTEERVEEDAEEGQENAS
jgi:hypothetical protein